MNPQVVNSGQDSQGNGFSHVLLGIEDGVTHFLTIIGGKATIHSFLATGEIVATNLNVPLLKAAFSILDNIIGA